jgi:hypothetical protein
MNNLDALKLRQPNLFNRVQNYLGTNPLYFLLPGDILTEDCSGIDLINSEIILYFGLGSGQHFNEIAKTILKYQIIIVIDKYLSPFIHYLNNFDYVRQAQCGTIFLCGEQDQEKLMPAVGQFLWSCITGKYTVIVNRKNITDYEWYQKFWLLFQKHYNAFYLSINTTKDCSPIILSNVIANIPNIVKYPGINEYENVYPESSAVICCAGPSLDENIETIKKYQDHFVLISVDTAWRSLNKAGIKPDFSIAVDYSEINLLKFDGIDCGNTITCLLPTVNPKTFEIISGQKVIHFMPSNLYVMLSACFGDKGTLESGGTVAYSAYSLARYIGCTKIIFAGLDLAFVGNKHHAENTMYHNHAYKETGRIMVESNDGGQVETAPNMWSFISLLENLFGRESEKDIIKINTSLHGAKIKNIFVKSFEQSINYNDSSENTKKPSAVRKSLPSYQGDPLTILGALMEQFKRIEALAHNGAMTCEYIITLAGLSEYDEKKIKAQAHTAGIIAGKIQELSATQDFIESLLLQTTFEFHRDTDSHDIYCPTKESIPRNIDKMRRFFNKIKSICKEYEEKIKNAMEAVK